MKIFSPIKAGRLSDIIGEEIRERLSRGELRPGDKLPSERDLAAQFRVSRNAVREALRMLEMNGVVRLMKGAKGGAFIGNGDAEALAIGLKDLLNLRGITIEQLTESRIWLAEIVTRVAVERASDAEIDLLETNVDDAERSFRQGDIERKLALQIEFHNIMARITQNPVLIVIVASVMALMHQVALTVGPEDNDLSLKSRRRFLAHVRARDAAKAVAEMTDHLEQLKERYVTLMREREGRRTVARPERS
jgi:GntR family transcriptional repressor for pyruvate dehydrogenase complex